MGLIMKLQFIILGFSLLITCLPINAQEGWFWQNPLPQGNDLNDVYFLDSSTGFAVGYCGTIIKTMNGGEDWEVLNSGVFDDFYGVFFANYNYGMAVGTNGVIIKTIQEIF